MGDAIEYSGKTEATLDLITTDNDAEYRDSIPTKLKIIRDLIAGKTAPEIRKHLNKDSTTKYSTAGLFVDSDIDTPFDGVAAA